MAMGSGRFFGWVIGGTLPAALGADWMVSAWDQNTGMRYPTPGTTGIEEVAATWLLDLLGLPATAGVGFVTGGTMANFTGLAAGRQHVLSQAGWDLDGDGLAGGPKVHVLGGEDRHATIDVALRYLGLGAPTPVAADEQGRIRPEALAAAVAAGRRPADRRAAGRQPALGCLRPVRRVHRGGARGAVPGCTSTAPSGCGRRPTPSPAAPGRRHGPGGLVGHRRAQDAEHAVRLRHRDRPRPRGAPRRRSAMQASYLINAADQGDPLDRVPELSRRARGVPVWAALTVAGAVRRRGLVDGLAANASAIADGIAAIPGAEILNDVVYTQVSVAFG